MLLITWNNILCAYILFIIRDKFDSFKIKAS